MQKRQFSIGELARVAGVPTSTLRYYERVGIIRPAGRTGANYRVFDDSSLEQLRFIRAAQASGFTLDDVQTLWALRSGESARSRSRAIALLLVSCDAAANGPVGDSYRPTDAGRCRSMRSPAAGPSVASHRSPRQPRSEASRAPVAYEVQFCCRGCVDEFKEHPDEFAVAVKAVADRVMIMPAGVDARALR